MPYFIKRSLWKEIFSNPPRGWLKIDAVPLSANRKTQSYTLEFEDVGKMIEMNSDSANNLTIPAASSVHFPIGTQILVTQYGVGQSTIVAGQGVTIRSKDDALNIGGQYSAATLVKIAENEWYAFGDLTT